jgi:hypothetical protein
LLRFVQEAVARASAGSESQAAALRAAQVERDKAVAALDAAHKVFAAERDNIIVRVFRGWKAL